MSPLLHAPPDEVVALAQELVRNPGRVPHADDAALQVAVEYVAAELEEYDWKLIAQAARRPSGEMSRHALELAIAHRIVKAQLAAPGPHAPGSGESRPRDAG